MSNQVKVTDPTQLSAATLGRLGLGEHPFTEHADEAYIYSDSQLDTTSSLIMEYLTRATVTIVLSGKEGIGKTTYLRKTLRLGYQKYQFCTLRAKQSIDFEYIENKIKQRWILPATHEQASIADLSIENYLIAYLREHPRSALIIDDAHLLGPATLDRLFTLKHRISLACPRGLSFILAGESGLKTTIASLEDSNPACAQIYQINVQPLSREQTGNYINHRLKIARLESKPEDKNILDDTQITRIYRATQGNIRQIHAQAILALQNQHPEGTFEHATGVNIIIKNPRSRMPVLLAALIVAVIVIVAVSSQIKFNGAQDIAIEKPVVNPATLPAPVARHTAQPDRQQTASLPFGQAGPADQAPAALVATMRLEDTPAPADTNGVSLPIEAIEQVNKDKLKIAEKSHSESVSQPSAGQNLISAADNSTKEENSISQANIVTNRTGPTQASEKPPPENFGEGWLKQLEPSHYTLQVVAIKDAKKLAALISKEKLKTEYAYFDKPVKGTMFHVLVMGHYKTRNAALAAIKNLPANLKKNKPWPVTLKSVQQHLD